MFLLFLYKRCTLLHGVTLGGTGNEMGDRHPKVGKDVLIGAGAKILGNISLGDGCKIGAGSIVLRPVPGGATAVGVPAKIVGFAKEKRPGSKIDMTLHNVLHTSTITTSSTDTTTNNNNNSSSLDVKSLSSTSTTRTVTSSSDSDDSLRPRNNSTSTDNTNPGLSISDTEDELTSTSNHTNTTKIRNINNNRDENDALSKNSIMAKQTDGTSGSFPSLNILKKSSRMKKKYSTSSGTRKCFVSKFFSYQNSTKDEDDDICSPFRSFSRKEVPKGAITYPELRSLLIHFAKATDEQAGEIFFSLLQKSEKPQVGYIYPLDVVESNFIHIAVHKVGLDQNDCQSVLEQIEGISTE